MEKYAARRVKQEIGRVLWAVWDPIGLNGLQDAPRDEYHAYVNPVFELLLKGASDEELATYLHEQVVVRMGLAGATREHMRETVRALREIKISSSDSDPSLRSGY